MLRAALLSALLAAPADGYETIFDGRSLRGWRHAGGATFERDGRTLRTVPGDGLGILWYARRQFRDFQLRVRFKAAPGANSGIHLRFPEPGGGCSWIDCGYEVQINDAPGGDPRKTGSIYGFADRFKPGRENRWTTLTIRVAGQTYTVFRDGRRINRYVGSRGRRGYIGLQAHGSPADVVRFGTIRVREL